VAVCFVAIALLLFGEGVELTGQGIGMIGSSLFFIVLAILAIAFMLSRGR
jgi:di/tricarboxylate transporter